MLGMHTYTQAVDYCPRPAAYLFMPPVAKRYYGILGKLLLRHASAHAWL